MLLAHRMMAMTLLTRTMVHDGLQEKDRAGGEWRDHGSRLLMLSVTFIMDTMPAAQALLITHIQSLPPSSALPSSWRLV